jgi:hypothetical protein
MFCWSGLAAVKIIQSMGEFALKLMETANIVRQPAFAVGRRPTVGRVDF